MYKAIAERGARPVIVAHLGRTEAWAVILAPLGSIQGHNETCIYV